MPAAALIFDMTTPQQRKGQTGEPTSNTGHFGSVPERAEADSVLEPPTTRHYVARRNTDGDFENEAGQFIASGHQGATAIRRLLAATQQFEEGDNRGRDIRDFTSVLALLDEEAKAAAAGRTAEVPEPGAPVAYRDENGDYRSPDGTYVASWAKTRDQVQAIHDTMATGIGLDEAREEAMANVRSVLALLDRERLAVIDQLLSARDPRIDGAAEALGLIVREHYPTAASLELDLMGNPWSTYERAYFRPKSIDDADGNQLHRFGVDLGVLGRKLTEYTPHLESDLDSFKELGPDGRDGSYRVRL